MTGAADGTPPTPRRRALVLALWAAVVLLALLQILRTPFVADLSAFLPASPDERQQILIEQVESGVPARTLLVGIDGGDAAARAAASRALAAKLRASGLFEQVGNGETEAWSDVGTWLFEHRYLLSPAVTPERFTAAGLREGLQDTLSLLGTPAGAIARPLFERDPTGETQRIAEGLIPSSAPRSEEGVWVSRSAPRALLVAMVRAPGADLDAMAAAIARVHDDFAAVAAPGLVLRVSGAPVFGVESRGRIEAEIKRLSIAGTVLVVGLLTLAFGSLAALAVAALPVATGVLVGIAAVGLGFGQVHGMTLAFGVTLIGEAVDYGIYYLIQARGLAGRGGWRAWVHEGWPTIRLGLLTSVCGFAALVFSGFPGLAQLGVFSVSGLVAAALFTRFVMPALRPQGAAGTLLRTALGRTGRSLLGAMPRLRWPLVALGVAAAVLLAQRSELWRAELASLSPIPQEVLALDASLRQDLSAGDARTLVVVQAADLQAVLELAEQAGARLEPLIDAGTIGGYDSIARWLPSLRMQQARLAALPAPDALQGALREAVAGLPVDAARLQPFVAEVAAARTQAPLTLPALRSGAAGASLAPLVDAMLLQRQGDDGPAGWVALLPLQPPIGAAPAPDGAEIDAAAVQQALAGLDAGDPAAVQVLEIGRELTGLYERYLGQAQLQALLGALGVVALMALTLRSPRRLLAVCQPLVLAVLLSMGALALAEVPLGILHLVGLLLVVAVGSNYALFFDLLQQPGQPAQADDDTLASLLLANLTTVATFALIAMSAIPALRAIGLVVAPGALLALLLAAAFARPHP
ncbi:MAG: MMPL family transporter [Rubrivivax sp.]|nr:MMPL family transporter [Rubrivivax sp.]